MSYFFEHGRFTSPAAQRAHAEARAELGHQTGLRAEQLAKLEDLGAPSVMSNFFALFANIGLGEVATIAVGTLLLCVFLYTSLPTYIEAALWLALTGGGLLVSVWNRKRFDRNIARKLQRAAQSISHLIDVPIVCFGHSHGPVVQRMPNDHRAFYVNTGSFLGHGHGDENEKHEAHYNTYVILERPTGLDYPTPLLYRWCVKSNSGVPIRSSRVKDKALPG